MEIVTNENDFVIDDDYKADWAIVKIKEYEIERDRIIKVSENTKEQLIKKYDEIIQKARQECDFETAYLKLMLKEYFETVEKKELKTQKKYKLPSGEIIQKNNTIELVKDEKKLLEYIKNNYEEFICQEPKILWKANF